jgi:hypothetical protein
MRRSSSFWLAPLAAMLLAPSDADGALYWFHGVRTSPITVCFVGDAVTSRPDRIQEVLDQLQEFELAANIEFDFLGACPAATAQGNGDDFFDGDIRVVLSNVGGTTVATWTGVDGTGPIPGDGCPMFLDGMGNYNGDNDGWGSWSNAPDDLAANRSCLYNLKLGDDPWNDTPYLNHTLHEFGHALGLRHEHERNDVDTSICSEAGFGGGASNGFMTPYDRFSVMHYQFTPCGIEGNYSYAGLSRWDRLALHIMYPQDPPVVEVIGRRVVRTTEPLTVGSAWQAQGANMSFVNQSFLWVAGGAPPSTATSISVFLPAGQHTLQAVQTDFLNQSYAVQLPVRVLPPADFAAKIAAPAAARAALY